MNCRRISALAVLALLTALVLAGGQAGAVPGRAKNLYATVTKVTDGDTMRCRVAGASENVRLIGIDAPETSRNEKFRRDARRDKAHKQRDLLGLGRMAREYAKRLVPLGSRVILEFDVQERDRYGRLLAYVWVKRDGRWVMLNSELLAAGLAQVMTIPPNVRHADYLYSVQKRARRERVGLWR